MLYIADFWLHEIKNKHDYEEGYVLGFSELDDDHWEMRKVEVFADGAAHFASAEQHSEYTELSIEALPPLSEMAADQEGELYQITREEFEHVWGIARQNKNIKDMEELFRAVRSNGLRLL